MPQYDILKGSTVVGSVTTTANSGNEHPGTLIIASIVGTRACGKAKVQFDEVVEHYDVNWDRLDDDRVLDEQPWGLEPR